MKQVRPELETCPICGSKGMHIHCYYGRSIIDFINGQPVKEDVCILRVVCDSCTHTHAVLPDIIIPYSSHSLFFILRLIAEYLLHRNTVESLCERFQITAKRLYAWLALWKKEKAGWLGLLEDQRIPSFSFLKSLTAMDRYSDFASGFLLLTRSSFLQTHANPVLPGRSDADYCQRMFSPDYDFQATT